VSWSILNFGKHRGKSLPQVIFNDPDWFFWAVGTKVFEGKGALGHEAADLARKATAIRIPNNDDNHLIAEYAVHPPTGKFSSMEIIPTERPKHEGSTHTVRRNVIDLSMAQRIAPYDKLGCRSLISSAKLVLFGSKSVRMDRVRCERFFDDRDNFET
jgi:hypothetical protein